MGYHFTDATNERWEIDVNVQTFIDCQDSLEIDLNKDAKAIFERCGGGDLKFTANLLFVVCEEQVRDRGLSDRDFGKRLKNETLNAAIKSFFRSLADFIQGLRGEALHKALDAAEKLETRMHAKLRSELDNPKLQDRIDAALDEIETSMSSSFVFNSPDRSESIPGD